MSDAEYLVGFLKQEMPKLKAHWRKQYAEGYQLRMDGKPRPLRRGCGRYDKMVRQAWDDADKKLKEQTDGQVIVIEPEPFTSRTGLTKRERT